MEARIEHDWPSGGVKVWLYQRHGRGLDVFQYEKDAEGGFRWRVEPVYEAALLPEPTFELPRDALPALIEAASDFLPPSAATDRHLKDAIEVRDRALSLIERLVP